MQTYLSQQRSAVSALTVQLAKACTVTLTSAICAVMLACICGQPDEAKPDLAVKGMDKSRCSLVDWASMKGVTSSSFLQMVGMSAQPPSSLLPLILITITCHAKTPTLELK